MRTSDSGYLAAGDGQLYYEAAGDGPPLLLIHGASADLRMWDEQAAELADSYRVIRYDLRGLGRSARPAGPYRMSGDALAVLDHLGVAAAAVIGFSTGGAIALELAARHPGRVSALVLIGAIIPAEPAEQRAATAAAHAELSAQLAPREAAAAAGDLAAAVAADLDVWASAHHGAGRERLQAWGMANPYFHEGMGEHEELGPVADGDLAALAVPALVIVGDQDVALSRLCAGHLATTIPGARHLVVGGADHFVSTARPGEFLSAVRGFLAGQDAAVSARER